MKICSFFFFLGGVEGKVVINLLCFKTVNLLLSFYPRLIPKDLLTKGLKGLELFDSPLNS